MPRNSDDRTLRLPPTFIRPSGHLPERKPAMFDLIFVGLTLGFFVLTALVIVAMGKI
ncbi:hypothetical protein [Pseudomonas protegens]|uniref:hypothetical protein n=1 Tax=Pseudomonas protegens TaxID=380021 RepID=UPI000B14B9D6|nr:hypothetical protein [Pseudomonas protegens]